MTTVHNNIVPRPAFLAVALFLLLGGLSAHGAVFVVPSDDEMIDEAEAIVLATAATNWTAQAANGDIVTYTRFTPERVLKGDVDPDKLLLVRELGGIAGNRIMATSAPVIYPLTHRFLIFLRRDREGEWQTWGAVLGKFHSTTNASGQSVLVRPAVPGVVTLTPQGRAHADEARPELDFVRHITRRVIEVGPRRAPAGARTTAPSVGGREPIGGTRSTPRAPGPPAEDVPWGGEAGVTTGESAEMWEVGTQSHFPPSSYTSGTFRWNVFDNGGTVRYFVNGSQPNYDSAGAAQRAVAAWTNEPNSNVSLAIAGTSTAGFVEDNQNTIVFNSLTDVPAGAIGYAKWYAGATHTYKGQTFYTTTEGDVVIGSGLNVSQAVFEEALTHELGHTLGFRHSDQGTPVSTEAVMRSSVSGRYGASLGPWDIEAVTHVYGSPATQCTPPSVATQPASQTITAGQQTTLTVAATGTPTLTYQWYTGTSGNTASPISGATGPSITVSPATTTSYWVRVTNTCGSANSNTATITIFAAPPPVARRRGDFDGNGYPDVLWRNRRTGENRIWLMNGVQVTGTVNLSPISDLNWQVGGVGDLNADGHQDIVWRHYGTGQNAVWFMNGTTFTSSALLPSIGDVNWRIESVVDFNRDGRYDLVWRNYATGANAVWYMSGTAIASTASLNSVGDLNWRLVGTGDTNGDGTADLVWRNRRTGENVLWLMVGATLRESTVLQTIPDQSWQIGAVETYNPDGTADLVWRNGANGQTAVWMLAGAQVGNTAYMPTETNLDWQIVGPR